MTDYAEEQAMELEALEAILADDLQGERGSEFLVMGQLLVVAAT